MFSSSSSRLAHVFGLSQQLGWGKIHSRNSTCFDDQEIQDWNWLKLNMVCTVYLTCQSKIVVRKCMEAKYSTSALSHQDHQKTNRNPHGVNSTSRFGIFLGRSSGVAIGVNMHHCFYAACVWQNAYTMLWTRDSVLFIPTGRGDPPFATVNSSISVHQVVYSIILPGNHGLKFPGCNLAAITYLHHGSLGAVRADMGKRGKQDE